MNTTSGLNEQWSHTTKESAHWDGVEVGFVAAQQFTLHRSIQSWYLCIQWLHRNSAFNTRLCNKANTTIVVTNNFPLFFFKVEKNLKNYFYNNLVEGSNF